ncbi:hypothetical protein RUND412_009866, partial [Rhizina undulata]
MILSKSNPYKNLSNQILQRVQLSLTRQLLYSSKKPKEQNLGTFHGEKGLLDPRLPYSMAGSHWTRLARHICILLAANNEYASEILIKSELQHKAEAINAPNSKEIRHETRARRFVKVNLLMSVAGQLQSYIYYGEVLRYLSFSFRGNGQILAEISFFKDTISTVFGYTAIRNFDIREQQFVDIDRIAGIGIVFQKIGREGKQKEQREKQKQQREKQKQQREKQKQQKEKQKENNHRSIFDAGNNLFSGISTNPNGYVRFDNTKFDKVRQLGKGSYGNAWLIENKSSKQKLVCKKILIPADGRREYLTFEQEYPKPCRKCIADAPEDRYSSLDILQIAGDHISDSHRKVKGWENCRFTTIIGVGSIEITWAEPQNEPLERLRLLMKDGIDLNRITYGPDQANPLHMAAKTGNRILTERLLEFGAETAAVDGKQQTALDLAKDNRDMVQLLLGKGVSPVYGKGGDGKSPCPTDIPSYHPGNPIDDSHLLGCGLAIAYKDNDDDVKPADFTIFSVNDKCVNGL